MRTLGHLFFHHPETIRDAAKGVAVKQGTVRQSWTRPLLSKQKVTPASSIQQPTPTLSTKPLRLTDPAVTTHRTHNPQHTFHEHSIVAPGGAFLVSSTYDQRRHPLPRRVAQNQPVHHTQDCLPKSSLESDLR